VVRAKYSVLLDEIGDSRGYHCIGRAGPPRQRDSATALISWFTTPVPPMRRQLATRAHKVSEQLIGITTSGGIKST
jgi:hypothetical protein